MFSAKGLSMYNKNWKSVQGKTQLRNAIYNFIINASDNDSTDGHSDESSDTEDVTLFMHVFLISYPYSAHKWTNIFGILHSPSNPPIHLWWHVMLCP